MAWIESHDTLARHPKTKRLARRLGVTVPAAIGHLHLLWWWALEYALDGNLSDFDAAEIADESMWSGEPAAFVAALIASGFVDETPQGLSVHDWEAYTDRWQRYKSSNAAKQKRYRDKRKTELDELRNRNVTGNATDNETVHQTKPNQTNNSSELLEPAGKITNIEDARIKELAEAFAVFWDAYPRKVGEDSASTAWFTLKPSAELRATIMESLEKHKQSQEWADEGGRYIPAPGKWLGERRWRDELTPARPKNPNRAFYGDGRLAL